MTDNEILIPQAKMPKSCFYCQYADENYLCFATDELVNDGEEDITEVRHKTCPLRTIEEHEKELKTKIYADLYSIAVRAEQQGGHISADYIKVKALQEGIEL